MDPNISAALSRGGIADMTTIGRRSGQPRRIEIYFHNFDGAIYIGGRPGRKRDWLANLMADPGFTLHLKRGVEADIPLRAEPITDPSTRQQIFYRMLTENWGVDPAKTEAILPRYVAESPLVKAELVLTN